MAPLFHNSQKYMSGDQIIQYDIIIIGGSFAGHAAALQLGRARQRVLLIDAGQPRNRFARSSHGFLGQDGRPPSSIMQSATEQLETYKTVEHRQAEVTQAVPIDRGFRVQILDGTGAIASRLILATGVRDSLPAIQGLQERWGVSVLHCPYCHGYELNQQPLGVLASGETSMHQALLVPDWGPTTLFTQGAFAPTTEQEAALAARNVQIETTPVVKLVGPGQSLQAVHLADGKAIELAGLFVAPATAPASDLPAQLGCEFRDGPTGPLVAVDERQETTVPGVFAAGDLASPMANATLSAASGVVAATSAHFSLIHDGPQQAA